MLLLVLCILLVTLSHSLAATNDTEAADRCDQLLGLIVQCAKNLAINNTDQYGVLRIQALDSPEVLCEVTLRLGHCLSPNITTILEDTGLVKECVDPYGLLMEILWTGFLCNHRPRTLSRNFACMKQGLMTPWLTDTEESRFIGKCLTEAIQTATNAPIPLDSYVIAKDCTSGNSTNSTMMQTIILDTDNGNGTTETQNGTSAMTCTNQYVHWYFTARAVLPTLESWQMCQYLLYEDACYLTAYRRFCGLSAAKLFRDGLIYLDRSRSRVYSCPMSFPLGALKPKYELFSLVNTQPDIVKPVDIWEPEPPRGVEITMENGKLKIEIGDGFQLGSTGPELPIDPEPPIEPEPPIDPELPIDPESSPEPESSTVSESSTDGKSSNDSKSSTDADSSTDAESSTKSEPSTDLENPIDPEDNGEAEYGSETEYNDGGYDGPPIIIVDVIEREWNKMKRH